MWVCSKCHENMENSVEICENCGAARDAGSSAASEEDSAAELNPMRCPRCRRELDYVGTRRFHEGKNWGILGEVGELFVKRETFDVYVCPRCGRVEFFVEGIGEEYRPH